ncbi:MAG: peptidoglycan DD-metalloendopeptidase family protein [Proteobacteria bacterium]|nr:peptidoglycan DD-metalloendopeptidase family protein [Pseudomonadota bacterium]
MRGHRGRGRRSLALVVLALLSVGPPPSAQGGAGLTGLLRRETTTLAALEGLTEQAVQQQATLEQLDARRQLIDVELGETRRRLMALTQRSAERRLQLAQRLRALYELSAGGQLRLLLEDQRPGAFLLKSAAVHYLLERDARELALYARERRQLARQQQALAEQQRKQRALSAALRQGQEEAERLRQAHRSSLTRIRRTRQARQALRSELSLAQRALLRKVAQLDSRLERAGGFAARRGHLPVPVEAPLAAGAAGTATAAGAASAAVGPTVGRGALVFAPARGAPVRVVHGGVVRVAQTLPGYGQLVLVDHGEGYYTLYGYLTQLAVEAGQRVFRGAAVGRAGLDPLSGDPAAYFELRHRELLLDARQWLRP